MKIDYIKHFSQSLGRDMEYKTYGDNGHAVLVFPSQNGRFYDYENMGMLVGCCLWGRTESDTTEVT